MVELIPGKSANLLMLRSAVLAFSGALFLVLAWMLGIVLDEGYATSPVVGILFGAGVACAVAHLVTQVRVASRVRKEFEAGYTTTRRHEGESGVAEVDGKTGLTIRRGDEAPLTEGERRTRIEKIRDPAHE